MEDAPHTHTCIRDNRLIGEETSLITRTAQLWNAKDAARGNNVRWSVDRRAIYFDGRVVIYCRLMTIATKDIPIPPTFKKMIGKSNSPPTSGTTDTLLKAEAECGKTLFLWGDSVFVWGKPDWMIN